MIRCWLAHLFLLLLTIPAAAQAPKAVWADETSGSASIRIRRAAAELTQFRAVRLQPVALRAALQSAIVDKSRAGSNSSPVIQLPLPDGSTQRFRVTETAVMHPELAARYPRIRTYAAQSLDDPTATARLDLTPAGFHAQILVGGATVFIDPAAPADTLHYRVFYQSAMRQEGAPCLSTAVKTRQPTATNQLRANGSQLRTYRLAVACTGEYATTLGGTKESALAGIVTTINRVSGIYEQELAIRLQLVPNNDALLFLDPATDPYTNNNATALLEENQRTTDETIGSTNYDLGHVFGTRVGGLAYIGVVCDTLFKAGGTTGQADPTGDAFAVDLVAHEMGHQFGADHTFNSITGFCSSRRTAAWAYEPGSGGSIMAYAGLCAPQNIQSSSFPFFHSRSLDQILDYIAAFSDCAQVTASGNKAPIVEAGGNFRIPARTPFILTGSGSDPDGDPVTYTWEQTDLGPTGALSAPVDDAPLFRFLPPSPSPTRTFPDVASLLAATPAPPGELLPTYARRLHFRLVARDQRRPGGGIDYDTTSVAVVATAGPFLVVAPTMGATWLAGAPQQVSWAVAATDQPPINAAQVDILLSVDGGVTFPTILAAATPNDGCQLVTLPAGLNTTTARIKVQATGNIFFAISPQNFAIQPATASTFYLVPTCAPGGILSLCPGSATTLDFTVGQLGGFAGDVNLSVAELPAGVIANFEMGTVRPGGTATLRVTTDATVAAGTYPVRISGSSSGQTREQLINLVVESALTQAPQPTSPDASLRTTRRPRFGWNALPGAASYDVDVATDASFSTIVASQANLPGLSFTPAVELVAGAQYFWRVRGRSSCNTGPYTTPIQFQTSPDTCQITEATRVPVPISGGPNAEATAVINVTSTERVAAIRVRNVVINTPNVSNLTITLTSPSGQQAVLWARSCPGAPNLSVSFDEQAPLLNCPPSAGATVNPVSSLANLLNEPATGDWKLTIRNQNAAPATLTSWALELCTIPTVPNSPAPNPVLADLEVFPNPSSGIFQVNLNDQQTGPVTMSVTDMLGRTVHTETLVKTAAPLRSRLNLQHVSRGVYHLHLITPQGTRVTRLVKE